MLHIHWKARHKTIAQELQRFFGKELFQFPIIRRSFSPVDLPNLQIAINQLTASSESSAVTLGYTSYHGDYQNSLRELIAPTSYASVGPVQFRDVDIDTENHIQCVENGIFLLQVRNGKVAAHIRGENYMTKGSIELEVMSDVPQVAAQFIEQIRESIIRSNIYRSKILSLECDQSWGAHGVNQVRFHQLPEVKREEIILPEKTLHLLERNTVHFARHAEVLKRSGRSLKRGLLLHGKPGTGKTHSIRWLTHALKGTTVILLSGEQL
ncbi:MAG TPA: hypothetical protein VJ521_13005, partial [Acidobacteriota bacterium]|nr:hypothetical protein [Acidobacteriota bacterium]